MKISTLNKILFYFKWIWSITAILLSTVIIVLQIDFIRSNGIKKKEVIVEIPKEVQKIVEIPKEIINYKNTSETVDLQGVIKKIEKSYHKDGRPANFMITNDCPPFTNSIVCFYTMDSAPTSNFNKAFNEID